MKFPRRLPLFRSLKFAPFALISLFLFSNLTGLLFSRVLAPVVIASPDTTLRIPADNITAGTKYLSWLLKRFAGNVELALAGYNAGEGSVDKYDGIPPYNETQNYVKIISKRYGKMYHPVPVTTNTTAD